MNWKNLKEQLINSEYYYFHTDNGILLCGDCVEVIKLLPKESIDLIITSPPYDSLRFYTCSNSGELNKLWNFDKFKLLAGYMFEVIKDGGVVVWIVNDATIKGSETGNSFRQALYFKDKCGFKLHDTMIYNKGNCPFPEKNRYYPCFEYMFVLSKGKPKTINLITDRINKTYGKKIKATTNRQPDGSLKLTSAEIKNSGKKIKKYGVRFNIWDISPGYNKSHTDSFAYKHPATFPEKLAYDHIISWSNEDEVICDPLFGSGTTLKMANILNRKWIGIEINPEYCEIARKRLE